MYAGKLEYQNRNEISVILQIIHIHKKERENMVWIT